MAARHHSVTVQKEKGLRFQCSAKDSTPAHIVAAFRACRLAVAFRPIDFRAYRATANPRVRRLDGYPLKLKRVEQASGEGKDVHQVHQVHQTNEINGLGGEHRGDHLKFEQAEMFTGDSGGFSGEHRASGITPNVHPDVHLVNGCKQIASELGEHPFADPSPDDSALVPRRRVSL
jgi:hypothetical protein